MSTNTSNGSQCSSSSNMATTGNKDMETSPGSESESLLTYRSPLCVQQHLSVAPGTSPPPPVSLMTPLTAEVNAHESGVGGGLAGLHRVDVTPSPSATTGSRSLLQPVHCTQTPGAYTEGGRESESRNLLCSNPILNQESPNITLPTNNNNNNISNAESTSTSHSVSFTHNAIIQNPSNGLLVMPTQVLSSAIPETSMSSPPSSSSSIITAVPQLSQQQQQQQQHSNNVNFSSSAGMRSFRLEGVEYRKYPWTLAQQLQEELQRNGEILLEPNTHTVTSPPVGVVNSSSQQQPMGATPMSGTGSSSNLYSTPSHTAGSCSSTGSVNGNSTQQQPIVVNHKEVTNFVKIDPRLSKLQHCVMCGKSDGVSIPTQNKNICKTCDSSFWYFVPWNVVIKFCKGCKNFFLLEEFSDKPEGTKCKKCRQRGRENYLTKKQILGGSTSASASVGGDVTSSYHQHHHVSCLAPSPAALSVPGGHVPASISVDGHSIGNGHAGEGLTRTHSQGSLSVDLEMMTGASDAGSLASIGGGLLQARSSSRNGAIALGTLDRVLAAAAQVERHTGQPSVPTLSIATPFDVGFLPDQSLSANSSRATTPGGNGGSNSARSNASVSRRKRKVGDASPANNSLDVVNNNTNSTDATIQGSSTDLDSSIALSASSSTSPSKAKLNVLTNALQMMFPDSEPSAQAQHSASGSKKRPPRMPKKLTTFSPSVGASSNEGFDDGFAHPDSAKSIGMTSGYFFGPHVEHFAVSGSTSSSLAAMTTPQSTFTPGGPRSKRILPPIDDSQQHSSDIHAAPSSSSSTTPRASSAALSSLVTPFPAGNVPAAPIPNETPDGRRLFDPMTPMVGVVGNVSSTSSGMYDYVNIHDVMSGSGNDIPLKGVTRFDKMRKRSFSMSSNNSDSPKQHQHDEEDRAVLGDGKMIADITPHHNEEGPEQKRIRDVKMEGESMGLTGTVRKQWEWDPFKNPLMALANVVTPGANNSQEKTNDPAAIKEQQLSARDGDASTTSLQ